MQIGEVRKGWKLRYVAKVKVEAGSTYNRGKISSPNFTKGEGGRITFEHLPRIYKDPQDAAGLVYVSPAGVAKLGRGVAHASQT